MKHLDGIFQRVIRLKDGTYYDRITKLRWTASLYHPLFPGSRLLKIRDKLSSCLLGWYLGVNGLEAGLVHIKSHLAPCLHAGCVINGVSRCRLNNRTVGGITTPQQYRDWWKIARFKWWCDRPPANLKPHVA